MTSPRIEDLAGVPLFGSLSRDELRAIAPLFTVRRFAGGAVIATAGDHLDQFNVILSGSVQWFWRDEAERELKLNPEGPGGHFADVTLGGEPILMSLSALDDVHVAAIPMAQFRELLLGQPKLAVAMLMDVVARLRRTLQATRTLAMEDVYSRMLKLLLARAVNVDGKPVAKITHSEIGQRVGATREMVGRLLRDLARGGYIEARRGRITVLRDLPRRW
jgi:CRP/FNR family transcriptional regulator, cyclic AMP receptor protein